MIGILALQGGFQAHGRMLDRLGLAHRLVRLPRDLEGLKGLILPGGESTTMLKLLDAFDLFEPLRDFGQSGKPVLGTCAGAILMCCEVSHPRQKSLSWVPASIERNYYGAQQHSFKAEVQLPAWQLCDVPALFIRAPRFSELDAEVQILSRQDEDLTGITWRQFTAVTYHPELTDDPRFHQAWIDRCVELCP